MVESISINGKQYLKWKSNCGLYNVSMSEFCFHKISEIAKRHIPREIGTSLVGYYSNDGFDAFILDIAPLSSDSKGLVSSFYRGVTGLQEFYTKLMQSFGRTRYYIGEWHSHPHGNPFPSSIDDQTQFAIASDIRVSCPECILVIIGENLSDRSELGVFVYSNKRGRIKLNSI